MSSLAPPPPDLRGFPDRTLRRGSSLFRIRRAPLGPWWFSSDGSGRFDLPPIGGRGTCYFATDPAGCFLEVFRDWLLVPEVEIRVRRISELLLESDLRLADCASEGARAFGLTAEIHAAPDYRQTRVWARAFADAGFDGVRYLLRHDPAQTQAGVGWFGAAGPSAPPGGHRHQAQIISPTLLAEVERRFGIRVLPTP